MEGLVQIQEKSYDAKLRAHGTKDIIHISLAFFGKQMAYLNKEISGA